MNTINDYNINQIKLLNIIAERSPQSQLLSTFKEVYSDTKEILGNRIPIVFDQYTIHNIGHSFRIMNYMYELISNPFSLSDLEIIILCYCALLHDVGMVVTDEEISLIKKDEYKIDSFVYSSFLNLYNNNERLALQEFVRKFHAKRAYDYVANNLRNVLRIPNHQTLSFWKEVGLICQSHNEGFNWISKNLTENEIRGTESFNPQFCACLLRLSDLLDIDDQRTPYKLYEIIKPIGYSDSEWRQHYLIYNYNKVSINMLGEKVISFFGHCNNPKIHRKLLSYLKWIDEELEGCIKLSKLMKIEYILKISENIQIDIKTEGYTFSDKKIAIDFKAITSLLIGEKIYGSKMIGLRELVQNGIDACSVRREEEIKNNFFSDHYKPFVNVIIMEKENTIIIKDNGIGMSLDTIKNHFLNVGSSYYKSNEFKLKNYSFSPIGNFGIGFLACFMLSPVVRVVTRHINSPKKYDIEIEEHSEYTSISEVDDLYFSGTEVILEYQSFVKVFSTSTLIEVKRFLETNFIDNGVKIQVIETSINFKTLVFNNLVLNGSVLDDRIRQNISRNSVEIEGVVEYSRLENELIHNFKDLFKFSLKGWPAKHKVQFIYHVTEDLELEKISFDDDISNYCKENQLNYLILSAEDPFRLNQKPKNYPLGENVNNTLLYGDLIIVFFHINQFESMCRYNPFPPDNITGIPTYKTEYIFSDIFSKRLHEKKIRSREVAFNSLYLFKSPTTGIYLPYINDGNKLFLNLSLHPRAPKTRNDLIIFSKDKNILAPELRLDLMAEEKNEIFTFSNRNIQNKQLEIINGKIFLKNVLVENINLRLHTNISFFVVERYKLNILGNDLFTNIARDALDTNSQKILHYKYVKEIQMQIVEHLQISDLERDTLKQFFSFTASQFLK